MRNGRSLLVNYYRTIVFSTVCRHFMGLSSSKMAQPVTVLPKERHTASVIFLHGLGDTGHGWCAAFDEISSHHIKYIFPNAPTQPVTLNGGMPMPSWFDIRSLKFDGPEDKEGIEQSSNLLRSLIDQEEKNGIASNRIVIGGFSQGGAVALHTAFTSGKQLGGVLALSTWLPLHKELEKCSPDPNLNILQCHGNADAVVHYQFGKMTAGLLSHRYKNHTFNTYSNMGHSSSPTEMADVKNFLTKLLPKV